MKRIFTFFALLMLFFSQIELISNIRIHSSATQTSMQTERINNIDYVNLKELSKLIFPNSSFNDRSGSIRMNNYEIKCSIGSFFVVFRDGENIKVSQMNLPAISFKQNIYVPIKSFIEALTNMDLIKADFTQSGLFVELNDILSKSISNHSTTPNAVTNERRAEPVNRSVIESGSIRVKVAPTPKTTPHSTDQAKTRIAPTNNIENLAPQSLNNSVNQTMPVTINEEKHNKVGIETIPTNKYIIPNSLNRSAVIPGE